jgi:hypothetical protein
MPTDGPGHSTAVAAAQWVASYVPAQGVESEGGEP